MFLTGRGALRDAFEARAARRNFKAIAVKTVWLEPADYPTLVGMADLGLCLHQSSSGLDLPMKLADLRGAGVPAAVFDYAPVLSEVMTSGQEGVTFRDPGDLANVLVTVATGSNSPDSPLARSRAWLPQHPPERWSAQWDQRGPARATPVTRSTDRSPWRATPEVPPRPRPRPAAAPPSRSASSGSRGPTSNS